MAKKDIEKDVDGKDEAALAKINDRPTLPNPSAPVNEEFLSHNWQQGSPAIDLRYAGTENTAVNVVAQERAKEEQAEKEEKEEKPISQAEYDRRTKLSVGDKDYINPSLGHHKVK